MSMRISPVNADNRSAKRYSFVGVELRSNRVVRRDRHLHEQKSGGYRTQQRAADLMMASWAVIINHSSG